jgi:dTDP-4-amino-4,6-dideoxygalactose transaminase
VEALLRADLHVSFYAGDEDLRPIASELNTLIGPRTRALCLVHYLGFPQDAPRWRAWCDERRLLLIEDAAQAWLSSLDGVPAGSDGDLALWSVYKTVGTPDGGAAICRAPLPAARRARRLRIGKLAHAHGAWLGERWGRLRRPRGDGEAVFDAAAHNALDDPHAPPAAATGYLLRRLSDTSVPDRRRKNYGVLLDALADHVPRPFAHIPEGACPWFFPIETEHKSRLIADLAGQGVGAMDFWSVPHPSLVPSDFPGAAHRRATTVALPVHQELRPADVERIASSAADWYRRHGWPQAQRLR